MKAAVRLPEGGEHEEMDVGGRDVCNSSGDGISSNDVDMRNRIRTLGAEERSGLGGL
jgi:hypothetical protein